MQTATAMKAKRNRKVTLPTARPVTQKVTVSHPTLAGAQESVERVIVTIDHMRQRKQFSSHPNPETRLVENERSYRAAERIKAAHDVIFGSIGGAMDFDRVRGPAMPGSAPAIAYLEAARLLSEIKSVLYALDHRVVVLVVCEGHSIETAAHIICRGVPSRSDKEEIGRALRQALRELAGRWFGSAQGDDRSRIVAHVEPGARPTVGDYMPVQRASTAHASSRKVDWK